MYQVIFNPINCKTVGLEITLVSLHRKSRKRCPDKARRISCAGSTVTSWPIFCVFLSLLSVLCVTITRLTPPVVSPLTNSPHPSPMLESHQCHWSSGQQLELFSGMLIIFYLNATKKIKRKSTKLYYWLLPSLLGLKGFLVYSDPHKPMADLITHTH